MPILLLPICGKILEKHIFNRLLSYPHTNNLITKNQSLFPPGDSTTKQLLYLIDEVHEAFDCTESFEVIAVFLDISKGVVRWIGFQVGTKWYIRQSIKAFSKLFN